jgi:hypothetical protein
MIHAFLSAAQALNEVVESVEFRVTMLQWQFLQRVRLAS